MEDQSLSKISNKNTIRHFITGGELLVGGSVKNYNEFTDRSVGEDKNSKLNRKESNLNSSRLTTRKRKLDTLHINSNESSSKFTDQDTNIEVSSNLCNDEVNFLFILVG